MRARHGPRSSCRRYCNTEQSKLIARGVLANSPRSAGLAWSPAIVLDYQHRDAVWRGPVDDRVREQAEAKTSSSSRPRRTDARKLKKKIGDAPELGDKLCCDARRACHLVEGGGFHEVCLGRRQNGNFHPGKRACSLEIASSNGTAFTLPASKSASLSSATASHAASASASASRLAIR